jgi:hypothetical protein
MNPEKQRIAIANACGWTFHPQCGWTWTNKCPEHGKQTIKSWLKGEHSGEKVFYDSSLPDYLNDLNAMHEAEKTLSYNDKQKYLDILADAPRDDIYYTYVDSVFATAGQRAEAFLRTVGRWEE